MLVFLLFIWVFKFFFSSLLFFGEVNNQLLVVGFRSYTPFCWFAGGGEDGVGKGRWEGQGYASPCRLLSTLCSQGCLLCGPQALGLWRVEYHLLIYHGWWWGGLKTQEHKDPAKTKTKPKITKHTHTQTKEKPTNTLMTEIKWGWTRKRA